MSENILNLIADMNKQMADLRSKVREKGKQGLADIAKDVFNQVEGLKKFVIIGYTPSFNDGEPCTHSSISGFGNYHWRKSYNSDYFYISSDDIGECGEWSEWFELDGMEPYEETDDASTPIVYANSGVKNADKAHELIRAMEDVCEMIYDTNYSVGFTLEEDGGVSVEYDDYDCGY